MTQPSQELLALRAQLQRLAGQPLVPRSATDAHRRRIERRAEQLRRIRRRTLALLACGALAATALVVSFVGSGEPPRLVPKHRPTAALISSGKGRASEQPRASRPFALRNEGSSPLVVVLAPGVGNVLLRPGARGVYDASGRRATVEHGAMVFALPPSAKDFEVRFADHRVVVLGAVFEVQVAPAAITLYRGEARWTLPDGSVRSLDENDLTQLGRAERRLLGLAGPPSRRGAALSDAQRVRPLERQMRPKLANRSPSLARHAAPAAKPRPARPADASASAATANVRRATPLPAAQQRRQSAEWSALFAAQQLLASGDPQGALGATDRYLARYPGGRYQQEALLLRIRALMRLGRLSDLVHTADLFIARFSNAPAAKRLRSLREQARRLEKSTAE
ncbi:MAG: hypothetical protein H6707_13550 [Deltaproteobacteria bacterium]|nr:hypothetical protein [Deltaproteobacteria bacterium]